MNDRQANIKEEKMEDSKIIELYWSRSESAILETSVKYGTFLRGLSMNILYSYEDAEECVNDTYMRTWNSIPPNRPSALRAWLSRITRNLSIDRYKAKTSQKRGGNETELMFSELEGCIPSSDTTDKEMEDREVARLISSFLRQQPAQSRIFFVRRYYYGDAVKQIAERFDINEGKVKSSLFRMRKKLKAYFDEEGISI